MPSLCRPFLHVAFVLDIILFLTDKTYSQNLPVLSYCSGRNYTYPSTYETNLRLLLTNLTAATPNSPFFFSSFAIGSPASIQAFGAAQCRLDATPTICSRCLHHAAIMSGTKQYGGCNQNTSAAFRYEFCLLRYSDIPFFGTIEGSYIITTYPIVNVSSSLAFDNRVQALLKKISKQAALSESRYAVADANYSGFDSNIYGMAWCSMDLTSSDCLQCLDLASSKLPKGRIAGQAAMVSCTARFSTEQFYSTPTLHTSFPARNTTILSRGPKKSSTKFILIGLLSGSFALIILITILFIFKRRMRRRVPPISSLQLSPSKHTEDSLMKNFEYLLLDLETIRTATKYFSTENKLGEGGFGAVYKGVLDDGQEIAVKRLSRTSKQGLKQLRNEMGFMAKLQHRNLVKVLGCCLKDKESLLVYEYLPNNSLDNYLSDPVRLTQLDWSTRYKIIEGIGRGLLYLHEDSQPRIIHRDLKASNILLDINLNPKISDFGIAKLFNMDETRGLTSQVAGTFGYMSPEYALHGNFSTKSDVYSYGVLVLEIISGRCNCSVIGSGTPLDLLSYVWHCWNQGMAFKVIDQSLGDRYSSQEALRCIHIGLLCVQEDPSLRPSMSSLVAMLTTNSLAVSDPLMPAFIKQIEF